MADKKLTELTEATEVDLTDQLYAVVGETSNRITVETLRDGLDALLADNNLSDLGDAATARTNLGLGTAAVEDDDRYAHRANNLSDLADAPTSRDNLGLGSAATEDDSRYVNVTDAQSVGGVKTFSDGIEADSYGGDGVTQSATDTTTGRVILTDHGWTAGNLLGTVSQSGGAPTGAVIERGSNSNGEYVRYADGTQICTNDDVAAASVDDQSGNWWRSGVFTWDFPVSFADRPFTYGGISGTSGTDLNRIVACFGQNSASQATMRVFSASGASSTTSRVGLCAVGRWF